MSESKGEITLAEKGLNQLGYDQAAFSFDHLPPSRPGFRMDPPPRATALVITNTESRKQKVYRLRQGISWSSQFLHDVRAGLFGAPPRHTVDP